ncbi:hypothetical protein ES705_08730 [subsurface metagenome]
MIKESEKTEYSFKKLIGKSLLDLPNRSFEDKVMQKVTFAQALKQKRSKNLKLSWIFLTISALLFPTGYISFFKHNNYDLLNSLGTNLQNPESIFIPASILIFSIIILLQIDNLLRLTFRTSVV